MSTDTELIDPTESEIKRFMAFGYSEFYPCGGMDDCKASFDDVNDALQFLKEDPYEFQYVFDRIKGVIIETDGI